MSKSISFTEYSYLCARIAYWLLENKRSFKKRDYYNGQKLADLEKQIIAGKRTLKNKNVNEYVEAAIFDNAKSLSFLPNYVTGNGNIKYFKDTYVDMANRVRAYEITNGVSPAIVYIQNPHNNVTNATSNTINDTYNYFVKKFGKLTDFDSALSKIQGRGYAYYYNSRYSNITSIDRMANRQGVNCTDSSQVFYKLALALGYTVQFCHIKCSGGDGHIRLRLKHPKNTGGQWIYRDPAAILNGNGIRSNWCTSGKVIAYDPKWIFTDL